MPVGFYIVTPIDTLKVGALVTVQPPGALETWLVDNRYVGRETPLLKHIAALPGSEVCRYGTTILIDGSPAAEARELDRLSRPLPVRDRGTRGQKAKSFVGQVTRKRFYTR